MAAVHGAALRLCSCQHAVFTVTMHSAPRILTRLLLACCSAQAEVEVPDGELVFVAQKSVMGKLN